VRSAVRLAPLASGAHDRAMILIAYDGTSNADRAIAVAGTLLRGGRAHIVHVWQPRAAVEDGFAFAGAGLPAGVPPLAEEIDRQEARARGVTDAGVELARAAGFDADGDAVRGDGSPAQMLESEIERLRPELVVIGSRGLTGLKGMLEGSVSHHVGAHAHAPVLIVPPAPDDA
jgi:nucleotide-binding universal stress UspA family protein